jgi:deoxyribose-phosphate aldolase
VDEFRDQVEVSPKLRRQLSVADVAAHLDHRLYAQQAGEDRVPNGCALAAEAGFAAVICAPPDVPQAARLLDGSGVQVVTALEWDAPTDTAMDTALVLEEARLLADQGADELMLITSKSRLDGSRNSFLRQTATVVRELGRRDVRIRVIVNTERMTATEITELAQGVGDAGAWMVQGGSLSGKRARFSELEVLRGALPSEVIVKWMQPVRSLDAMLLCIAEGVGRFNADVEDILATAQLRAQSGPLMVPLPGWDY